MRTRGHSAWGAGYVGVGGFAGHSEFNTANFELALAERAPAFPFSFAAPASRLHRAKDAWADALLSQGNEVGGHTGEMNLLPLLVELVECYPHLPALAAEGITSGRDAEIIAHREELVTAARARHDPEGASVYMGQGAGHINSIRPAADVIRGICQNAEGILRGWRVCLAKGDLLCQGDSVARL